MALGNYGQAKDDLTRELNEGANNERAHYFRGVALVALGKNEDGITDLTSSLMRNNNRGIGHFFPFGPLSLSINDSWNYQSTTILLSLKL